MCFNGGVKGTFTQMHYYYKSDFKNEWIRISKKDYSELKREEDATQQILYFDINYEEMTKPACKCSTGWAGLQCQIQLFTKCFVNITDPAFYDMEKCR